LILALLQSKKKSTLLWKLNNLFSNSLVPNHAQHGGTSFEAFRTQICSGSCRLRLPASIVFAAGDRAMAISSQTPQYNTVQTHAMAFNFPTGDQ
jgi:hypothetical protein